jgi:hypothetical protein
MRASCSSCTAATFPSYSRRSAPTATANAFCAWRRAAACSTSRALSATLASVFLGEVNVHYVKWSVNKHAHSRLWIRTHRGTPVCEPRPPPSACPVSPPAPRGPLHFQIILCQSREEKGGSVRQYSTQQPANVHVCTASGGTSRRTDLALHQLLQLLPHRLPEPLPPRLRVNGRRGGERVRLDEPGSGWAVTAAK